MKVRNEPAKWVSEQLRETLTEQGWRRLGAIKDAEEETQALALKIRQARDAGISVTEAAKLAQVSRVTAHAMLKGE